ncbi:MAG: G-Protein alpha subunit [Caeruleum heppii]|nr:MAG: G-Protein alpha subunit [Caeruleum heppii]
MFKMCFGSSGDDDQKKGLARTREIDGMIRRDEKKKSNEVKLLLLGAGESGKSTVLKQMKLIYASGFSKSEREDWRAIIFSNINNAYKVILEAMEELEIGLAEPSNEQYVALVVLDRDLGSKETLPAEYLIAFKNLWTDAGIQNAIEKGNEFALHDNLTYFFSDIDRLFAKDYIPTDQDVLRSRLRTTGITETIFELGSLTYRMFDVGGQRSERKKWIHCFEGVNCLLFLVAISGYDQCLVEDKDANQMQEALMLFESIVNSQWFARSAIILFLNKIDLFKEKLPGSAISRYFPDYTGDPTDNRLASKFFETKFRGLNRNPNKDIYSHFTNATDTNLLKITMTSVQDMIIQRNLHQLIL